MQNKLKRGFGSPKYDKAIQKKAASKGGKTAHARGTAYEWTVEQAREAGKKGGRKSVEVRR
jgi:uncharacterized protein